MAILFLAIENMPPTFRPMSVVAKRLGGSGCHLVRSYASAQATMC